MLALLLYMNDAVKQL